MFTKSLLAGACILFLLSSVLPRANAYPISYANFWTASSIGSERAYVYGGRVVVTSLNMRSSTWSVVGRAGISLETWVDTELTMHSVLVANVIYNDVTNSNDPGIATISASESADGAYSIGLKVIDTDDGSVLLDTAGEQAVTEGSIFIH